MGSNKKTIVKTQNIEGLMKSIVNKLLNEDKPGVLFTCRSSEEIKYLSICSGLTITHILHVCHISKRFT